MKLKALADKVVIRVETNKIKKVGNKEIHIETEQKEFTKMFVDSIGPEVKRDIKEGQEVLLYAHTAAVYHPSAKDIIVVSENDIWATIE